MYNSKAKKENLILKWPEGEFPETVVRISGFHYHAHMLSRFSCVQLFVNLWTVAHHSPGSIPGWGTEILQAAQCGQKKNGQRI